MEEGLIPILPVLTQRHVVLVQQWPIQLFEVMATQRDTSDEVYIAASAEAQQQRNRKMIRLLHRYGAEVVEAQPDDLPLAVGDAYLRLKAAGRL